MTIESYHLASNQLQRLRTAHPYVEPLDWLLEVVRTQGWLAANIRYLERERERSAQAMRDLMWELGLQQVTSYAEALELLRLACIVFAPEPGFQGSTTRQSDSQLRIANEQCPVYQLLEDHQWLCVTACPSWHRRRGWIDALGIIATDTVLAEKKWGDPACVAVVEVVRLPA